MGDLSPHFSRAEFRCKDGSEHEIACELLCMLEAIRANFGPVQIVSGYRSPGYNTTVGGAKESFHMRGMAADIWVPNHTPREVFAWADTYFEVGGLGLYVSWVHVDCRREKVCWMR